MGWAMAAAAGISALGSAFGKGKEQTPTIEPLYTDAGHVGDTMGSTKAPPDPTIQGSFPKANEFLGSNIGKLGTDAAGGFLSDYRAQRNTRKNHNFLKSKGLNSWEIASGGSGGPISSQGNTLGSGPATQINQQQSFAAQQAQLDRDNRKEVAHITSAPGTTQAATGERRDLRDAQKAPLEREQIASQIKKINADSQMMEFRYENFWEIRFSEMGPENMKIALAMFNSGLSLERVLSAAGDITEKEKRQVEDAFNVMMKTQGGPGAVVGWLQLMKAFMLGKGTLNNERNFMQGTWDEGYGPGANAPKMKMESIYRRTDEEKNRTGR